MKAIFLLGLGLILSPQFAAGDEPMQLSHAGECPLQECAAKKSTHPSALNSARGIYAAAVEVGLSARQMKEVTECTDTVPEAPGDVSAQESEKDIHAHITNERTVVYQQVLLVQCGYKLGENDAKVLEELQKSLQAERQSAHDDGLTDAQVEADPKIMDIKAKIDAQVGRAQLSYQNADNHVSIANERLAPDHYWGHYVHDDKPVTYPKCYAALKCQVDLMKQDLQAAAQRLQAAPQ